ncbi:MAG: flap endonuclease [Actinobacteria bacterium]|nr:flap endonuclease [Actinomycetota bacterium]
MKVHLVDGTFELFRCFHGAPRAQHDGREVGAARGWFATLVSLLRDMEVTHLAVAFDSVIAPPPTKGGGAEALIAAQAPLAAAVCRALNVVVWPSGRYQADELLSTGAAKYSADERVQQVVICATDNDFNQCVRGERVVVLDRIRSVVTDEAVVRERYGISPQQIPDLFALVGDRSDGLPGVPGWGAKSASALLRRYDVLEAIPLDHTQWDVQVRGAASLAAALRGMYDEALLCRNLSRLRTDLPVHHSLDQLAWPGADVAKVAALVDVLGDDTPVARVRRWAG